MHLSVFLDLVDQVLRELLVRKQALTFHDWDVLVFLALKIFPFDLMSMSSSKLVMVASTVAMLVLPVI